MKRWSTRTNGLPQKIRLAWAVLALAFVFAEIVGFVDYLVHDAGYRVRANAAQQNAPYLALYNARRSGDLVTVAGVASTNAFEVPGEPYVSIDLDDVDRSVALDGLYANVCRGDSVAVSGVYHYASGGGWIEVRDLRNVDVRWGGVLRNNYLLRLLFPRICWGL